MRSKYGKAGSAGPARAGIKAVSTCLCAMAPSHEHQSGVLGHMAPRSDTTLSLSQGMAKGKAERKAEGKAEGRKEGLFEVAKSLLGSGMSVCDVSRHTGLTEVEIGEMLR